MGGLEIRNKYLRCANCLEIKRVSIIPHITNSKVSFKCRCIDTEEHDLFDYVKNLKKKEDFLIKCAKCQTESPKVAKYCYQCKKIYCSKCLDFHTQLTNLTSEEKKENEEKDINDIISHMLIDMEKFDYYCVLHQKEKFTGFCKKCQVNICAQCQKEDVHKGHVVHLFSKILIDKKKEKMIKDYYKYAKIKIDYNTKVSRLLKNEFKKKTEKRKRIKLLYIENEKVNEKILELFDFLRDIYDSTKNKNFSIIYNVLHTASLFNVKRIEFTDKKNYEADSEKLIDYLKNDFIITTEDEKKKNQDKKDDKNDNSTHDEDVADLKDIDHDIKEGMDKEPIKNLDEKKNDSDDDEDEGEEKKKDDKKEDGKKDEEKKDEEKKDEEKKDEEKRDEEKKEEEKKDEEKKDEEKKDDKKEEKVEEKKPVQNWGPGASLQEKRAFLMKMMAGKGIPGKPMERKEVKIEQERVEGEAVNIINKLQIAKGNKKKPKKVAFTSDE